MYDRVMSAAPLHPCHHDPALRDSADAVPAPARLLAGPGRSWDAEARWGHAQIRVGGRWHVARVERWRLRLGDRRWSAWVAWEDEDGLTVGGWYLCGGPGMRTFASR